MGHFDILSKHYNLETGWHVFMVCRFGLNCWKEAGLSNIVDEWIEKADSMKDVINFCSSYPDCWTAAKFCLILWSLWRERNNEVWNKSHASPAGTIKSALCVLSDWCAANNVEMPSAASVDSNILNGVKWNKPTFPFFKCNVDASLSTITFSTGIGMVIRDDNGEFVVARTVRFPGVFSVREAEAMGVRKPCLGLKIWVFRKVILETDAKYIVEGIKSVEFGDSEYDSILKECQLMF
ncbi:hypothetical protein DH2020_041240 [Rehmannia glutinosa]|uniref:RNase H type-1 domain-containing protein n=1 Tax=Rehmannia glutinosa TaxID=99300 RepID=A0ABR0URR8_REHGL